MKRAWRRWSNPTLRRRAAPAHAKSRSCRSSAPRSRSRLRLQIAAGPSRGAPTRNVDGAQQRNGRHLHPSLPQVRFIVTPETVDTNNCSTPVISPPDTRREDWHAACASAANSCHAAGKDPVLSPACPLPARLARARTLHTRRRNTWSSFALELDAVCRTTPRPAHPTRGSCGGVPGQHRPSFSAKHQYHSRLCQLFMHRLCSAKLPRQTPLFPARSGGLVSHRSQLQIRVHLCPWAKASFAFA